MFQLRHRKEFPVLLNELGLLSWALELGTHQGEFAAAFLSAWRGEKLVCVDPWQQDLEGYWEMRDRPRLPDFEICQDRLEEFQSRVEYWLLTSEQAAPLFVDGSLGFVYVDANHDYLPVANDLRLWWPKIASGGILAGHDWYINKEGGFWLEVQRAVKEFALEQGLEITLVPGERPTNDLPLGNCPSWFVRRP